MDLTKTFQPHFEIPDDFGRQHIRIGGIGQHIVDAHAGIGRQGVGWQDKGIAVKIADVMEEEVHQGQATGAGDNLFVGGCLVFEQLPLILAQAVMPRCCAAPQKDPARSGSIFHRPHRLNTRNRV